VSELIPELLDATRLLVGLRQVSDIAQGLSSELTPEAIAQQITDSLVEKFDCAFSRIWLVEADQLSLRLVSSSGLYTRTDGSFSQVPMGAFKVGKIAKNRIAFLSNNLPEEPWVKDRQWAIANRIKGFAGYPLSIGDRVIGVLATFSYRPLTLEFLEVLRFLCALVTVTLDAARRCKPTISAANPTLSEQLAEILPSLTLVGTEQSLMPSLQCIFLRTAEVLGQMDCNYCRLTYGQDSVAFAAILTSPQPPLESELGPIQTAAACLGGSLQTQLSQNHPTIQILLTLPYVHSPVTSQLSERELATLRLLSEGWRDRDIAQKLMISESTVKFHMNNVMTKLKAKTRYQALYLAAMNGWVR
jgi:DNA-binding CsgD family transcriptional regulator/GAF domain-containing protein